MTGERATAAVTVRGLVKRYGGLTAVDGLDLRAAVGPVLALLGPNGAGKTTTVEVCEGFLRRRRRRGPGARRSTRPARPTRCGPGSA